MLALEGEGQTKTASIIRALRLRFSGDIQKASRRLEDIALTKLISEVASRRPRTADATHDLFAAFDGLPQHIAIPGTADEKGQLTRKTIPLATFSEARAWALSQTAPRKKNRKKEELLNVLGVLDEFKTSDESPIGEAFEKWRHEQSKNAERK